LSSKEWGQLSKIAGIFYNLFGASWHDAIMAIEEGKLELPITSKWACIYSRKGRARYLDMLAVYADGSLDKFPFGSINLDAPLILLNPDHESANPTRPSNIANACDLFTDSTCYGLLRLVEEHIHEWKLFEAIDPLIYFVAKFDEQLRPSAIVPFHYAEALGQLRTAPAGERDDPKPKP